MPSRIYRELGPVRRRQGGLFLIRSLAVGLLIGSVAGIGLGLGRWLTSTPIPSSLIIAVIVAGPCLGGLFGLERRKGWQMAAAVVDAHYGLKDRAATALDFVNKPQESPVHELQLADAERHLSEVEPDRVVPFRLPRAVPIACGALVVALAILVLPPASRLAKAGPSAPLPEIVAEAATIREDLKDLDQLAKKERNKDLQKLVQELQEKVEALEKPGVDRKEALAKLSEMQAALTAQQSKYNVGLVDGQLQSLGEALGAAEPLEAASQALQEGKYDKAAEKLENLDGAKLDRKEAKAVAEKLKKVAKAMGEAGLGQLGEATSQMADGLREGDESKCKDGSCKLAGLCRSHGKRKQINNLLCVQCNRLGECKGRCQKNSYARLRLQKKSDSPSETFGMSTSGNLHGDKTNLGAGRDRKEITGSPGEGPSESETVHSPEGRQLATREYREVYKKYRKMSEAVLDNEPIPLGQRQTIRRYFELIRPRGEESEQAIAPTVAPIESR